MVPIPPSLIFCEDLVLAFDESTGDRQGNGTSREPFPIVTAARPETQSRESAARKLLLPYNGSMAVTSPGERYPAVSLPATRGLSALLISARPAQWVKNLVLPLPFLFGGALSSAQGWKLAAAGFAVFCAITSAIYLVNDVMDRERDRAHPVKRRRPLAAGELGVGTAIAAAAVLGVVGLAAAFLLSRSFGMLVRPLRGADARLFAVVEEDSVPRSPDRRRGAALAGAGGRRPCRPRRIDLPHGVRLPARPLSRDREAAVGAAARRPDLLFRAPAGSRGVSRRRTRLPVRRHGAVDGCGVLGLHRRAVHDLDPRRSLARRSRCRSSFSGWRGTCASSTGRAAAAVRRRRC